MLKESIKWLKTRHVEHPSYQCRTSFTFLSPIAVPQKDTESPWEAEAKILSFSHIFSQPSICELVDIFNRSIFPYSKCLLIGSRSKMNLPPRFLLNRKPLGKSETNLKFSEPAGFSRVYITFKFLRPTIFSPYLSLSPALFSDDVYLDVFRGLLARPEIKNQHLGARMDGSEDGA